MKRENAACAERLLSYPGAVTVYADGRVEHTSLAALSEHTLSVCVNDRPWAKIVCTCTALRELVTGRLCTQRLIAAADEIGALDFSEDGARADASLIGSVAPRPLRRFRHAARWEDEWIFALARRFDEELPLHRATRSAHCAFLSRGGEVLCTAEDVGRHNAVDKVVGAALLSGAALGDCVLFTSGRVPLDMAEKAVAAGVPVLASKASATAEAIRFARAYGLTLICRVREDCFTVFDSSTPL